MDAGFTSHYEYLVGINLIGHWVECWNPVFLFNIVAGFPLVKLYIIPIKLVLLVVVVSTYHIQVFVLKQTTWSLKFLSVNQWCYFNPFIILYVIIFTLLNTLILWFLRNIIHIFAFNFVFIVFFVVQNVI